MLIHAYEGSHRTKLSTAAHSHIPLNHTRQNKHKAIVGQRERERDIHFAPCENPVAYRGLAALQEPMRAGIGHAHSAITESLYKPPTDSSEQVTGTLPANCLKPWHVFAPWSSDIFCFN